MTDYHNPVMLEPCIEALKIIPNGKYIDVTFGGGGHSKAILEKLNEKGKLLIFDRDDDAFTNQINDKRVVAANHNYRFLYRFARYFEMLEADGLIADLGISSYQIDEASRGFAHRFDSELDMRMNRKETKNAKSILNTYNKDELLRIFKTYAEINRAPAVADAVIRARSIEEIKTTGQLKTILSPFAKRGEENKFYSQIFQALRIEVNDELESLKQMLLQCHEVLKSGGRLVVMSYHSLEDRLVKNYFNSGNFEGKLDKDLYGNIKKPFKAIGKMLTADETELSNNSRARSAKLRIAEKA